MPILNIEDDPLLDILLRSYDQASKTRRSALLELRRYHLNTDKPDPIRSALLQQIAHESEQKLSELSEALVRIGWEFVSFSENKSELAKIKTRKEETKSRILSAKTEKLNSKTIISTNTNGRIRHFEE